MGEYTLLEFTVLKTSTKRFQNLQVVGFDCVDDESKPERRPTKSMPTPAEWSTKYNPAYSYYIYYLYANLYVLNKFR
jgi:AMP deaminase